MKIKDGFKYSTKEFDGYKIRTNIEYKLANTSVVLFDCYTDNTNPDEVLEVISSAIERKFSNSKLESVKLKKWYTAEQDKIVGDFVDSFLSEL